MDELFLQPEDYAEPSCLLCDEPYGAVPESRTVPQRRILDKMDEYISHRDYAGAERHLLYWLEEARLGRDKRGELLICNELVGHYRKTANKEKAYAYADEALSLLWDLSYDGTISSGTTYINVATAYSAFGDNDKSLELFQKARAVYESNPRTSSQLLGGLYNNMGLALCALRHFPEANQLYDKAIEAMKDVPGGVLEQAITCLNKANALEEELGMETAEPRIFELVDQAYDLLTKSDVKQDGYYAFVCEKCVPTFSYYGYFLAAEELTKRAESIYERT